MDARGRVVAELVSDLAVDSPSTFADSAGMKTLRKTLFAIAVILFTAQAVNGMTAAEARKAFEQFVQKQTEDAKRLAHEAQTLDDSNKEKCAKLRSALFALGRAIHADADSMSPMHNFAEWPGVIGGLTQKGLIDFFHDIHVHQDGENMDVFNAHPEVMRKLSGKYDPLIKSLSQ